MFGLHWLEKCVENYARFFVFVFANIMHVEFFFIFIVSLSFPVGVSHVARFASLYGMWPSSSLLLYM